MNMIKPVRYPSALFATDGNTTPTRPAQKDKIPSPVYTSSVSDRDSPAKWTTGILVGWNDRGPLDEHGYPKAEGTPSQKDLANGVYGYTAPFPFGDAKGTAPDLMCTLPVSPEVAKQEALKAVRSYVRFLQGELIDMCAFQGYVLLRCRGWISCAHWAGKVLPVLHAEHWGEDEYLHGAINVGNTTNIVITGEFSQPGGLARFIWVSPQGRAATGQLKDYMGIEEARQDAHDEHIMVVSLWEYGQVQEAAMSVSCDDNAVIFVLWEESTEDVWAGVDDDEQWWPKGYYRHDLR